MIGRPGRRFNSRAADGQCQFEVARIVMRGLVCPVNSAAPPAQDCCINWRPYRIMECRELSRKALLSGVLIAAMAALPRAPGKANDSAAELAAGGLVLVKTDAISIQREDLTVSPTGVRVRYEIPHCATAA